MPELVTFYSFRKQKGGVAKLLWGPCWTAWGLRLSDFLPHCGLLSRCIKVAGATRHFASISNSGLVKSMAEMLGCFRARVLVLGSVEGV